MHGDRGLSGGVQVTLLFPLAFTMLMLTLQWGLSAWADATALAAAQDGARVAAAIGGSAVGGVSTAKEAATNGALTDLTVDVERGAMNTTVTVKGRALAVIPGWSPEVSKTVRTPTERLTRS